MSEQYVGLNPGASYVEAVYIEDLFLETGEDTYNNWVVAAGQVLTVGSIVGVETATGEIKLCDDSAGDGSEVPFGICVHNVDTTGGATEISILEKTTRRINANVLKYAGGWTLATLKKPMADAGFSIRTPGYSG